MDILASRLESVLELLGKLLGVVQLQANLVLPLLRTACQVLTVEGLDILHVKSVGPCLTSSPFSCQVCRSVPKFFSFLKIA